MLTEIVETSDRWILPLRGSAITQIDKNEETAFELEPPGLITVGQDALLTRGSPLSEKVTLTTVSEFDGMSIQHMVGARVVSSVCFKTGGMRIVFDNGWHLTVDSNRPFTSASVSSGGSILWKRPKY